MELRSDYAWIVDSENEKRIIPKVGPWNADAELIGLLERGDFGREFRIFSGGNLIHKGRILGQFEARSPLRDMGFVEDLDVIEYKNTNGYWEEV